MVRPFFAHAPTDSPAGCHGIPLGIPAVPRMLALRGRVVPLYKAGVLGQRRLTGRATFPARRCGVRGDPWTVHDL